MSWSSSATSASLVVVLPESMPSHTRRRPLRTWDFAASLSGPCGSSGSWLRCSKALRSAAVSKKGLPGAWSSSALVKPASVCAAAAGSMVAGVSANMPESDSAAPRATMVSGCSGTMAWSSPRLSRSLKTLISAGLNVSGPPSKMMGGHTSMPCARPPSVCLAMAWKADKARSSRDAPWLSRGWMSVLAYTPQRPEMS